MKRMKKLQTLALCLLFAMGAQAGTVTMKTAKATGEKIAIAVNYGIPFTLTWGDGTQEEAVATGQPQEFSVKAASLTLSSERDITSLYVAENDLTELNVAGIAGSLRRLYCPQNQLQKLDLSACKELVSLDCQGNQLTSLTVASTVLEDYNVADNQLTTVGLRSGGNITSMVCANNQLATVNYVATMTGLKTLFCQGNEITSIGLSKCTELQHVLISDNKLKTFNSKPLVNLQDLWIDNNSLETLDLSDNTVLVGLVAANNRLNTILWNAGCRNTFKYTDLSNNALFFDQLPTVYNRSKQERTVDGIIGPQDDYHLLDNMNVNVTTEAFKSLRRNGWEAAFTSAVSMTDDSGATLVPDEDYQFSNYRFTFLKPLKGVVISITSESYPDLVIKTLPIDIIDPSGIDLTTSEEGGVQTVYDLSGRRMSGAALGKGVYIVNGKKVVIR